MEVCSLCDAFEAHFDYYDIVVGPTGSDVDTLCHACVTSELAKKTLRHEPLAPPEWWYVAYPWDEQSDSFRSPACRLVTRDMDELRVFRPAGCSALVYGYVRPEALKECWNGVLKQALRHGGPPPPPLGFTDDFFRSIWKYDGLRVSLRVPRSPVVYSLMCPSDYGSVDDMIEEAHELIGDAHDWFPFVGDDDVVPVGCGVPSASQYAWFVNPRECVHDWYSSVDELDRARWDPLLREPDEIKYTRVW